MLMSVIASNILNIYERSYYFIEINRLGAANLLHITNSYFADVAKNVHRVTFWFSDGSKGQIYQVS